MDAFIHAWVEGRRAGCRPCTRWLDGVEKAGSARSLKLRDANVKCNGKEQWRNIVKVRIAVGVYIVWPRLPLTCNNEGVDSNVAKSVATWNLGRAGPITNWVKPPLMMTRALQKLLFLELHVIFTEFQEVPARVREWYWCVVFSLCLVRLLSEIGSTRFGIRKLFL